MVVSPHRLRRDMHCWRTIPAVATEKPLLERRHFDHTVPGFEFHTGEVDYTV